MSSPPDPYAPPAAHPPAARVARSIASPAPFVVYAFAAASFLYFGLAVFSGPLGLEDNQLTALDRAGTLVMLAFNLSGITWLQSVFRRLPVEVRDGRFDGGQVLGKFFVPLYNLYWMFAVTAGVCDVLNDGLAVRQRPRTAPRAFANVACVVHLLAGAIARVAARDEEGSLLGFAGLLPLILWVVFTVRVEASLRELAEAVGAEPA